MQTKKATKKWSLCICKVSWKFRIPIIYQFVIMNPELSGTNKLYGFTIQIFQDRTDKLRICETAALTGHV